MDKSSINPASEVDVAPVIGSPQEPLEKVGKREAEDAIEKDVVSAKKQKVEEEQSEVKKEIENCKLDTSPSESEQQMKVCAMEGQAGSFSGEGSSDLEEDASAAKKKPAVAENSEHSAVPKKRDESSDDSDSSYKNETNEADDFVATKHNPGSLANKGPVAPAKKTDGSNEDHGSSNEDEANEDDDIAAAKEDHTTPNTKKSRVSMQEKDNSESNERTRSPVNAAMAEKTDAAPTNMDPVNATDSKKKDESINDDECFDEDDVTTKNISAPVTNKKEQPYEESEFGNKPSDDPKTNATPKERTAAKTLYVGNLSFSVEQEDVEHFFEAAGEIVGIRFGMNPDESFKGYGFVEFSSPEAAEKALHELNGKELLRRRVKLDLVRERGSYTPYSSSKDAQSFQNGGRAQGHRIFVCGFNKNDGEDKIRSSLKERFGSCGEITRVSIPTDQDGAFKGIAFIHFKDSDACTRALEINGSEFGGSTLSVEEARPRHDSCDNFHSSGGRGWRSGGWGFGGRSGGRGFGSSSGRWFGSGGGRWVGRSCGRWERGTPS